MVETNIPEIYVASHKNFYTPHDESYKPIFVGKALQPDLEIKMIGDDTGDNISSFNKSFCELTAIYWIWKNSKRDLVGLNHYRRFFKAHESDIKMFQNTETGDLYGYDGERRVASAADFSEFSRGVDIIAATPVSAMGTIKQNFENFHNGMDLYLMREVIRRLHPSYVDAFDFFLSYTSLSNCNMFVGKKEVLDDYFKWIFDIVFAMKEMRFYRDYQGYQARIFGFVSERLFNVWLCKNREHYCVAYRDIENFENESMNLIS